MYVTLTDLQNGEPVYLTRPLAGRLEVALCELTYYHQFYNISTALKIIGSEMDRRRYLMGITTFASWTIFPAFECRTYFAYTNGSLTAIYGETSEFARDIKQRAGETPWLFSGDIPTGQRVHRGQATQTCCLSGDLCAPG